MEEHLEQQGYFIINSWDVLINSTIIMGKVNSGDWVAF